MIVRKNYANIFVLKMIYIYICKLTLNSYTMRQKILIAGIVTIVAVAGIFSLGGKLNVSNVSDIALRNIEALASGEEDGTPVVTIPCVADREETCTYTAKLISGETLDRKEKGARNVQ